MTITPSGCCHPEKGSHTRNEPSTCCHVHSESLPSNRDAQQGEPDTPPDEWTAQHQHREAELVQEIAETNRRIQEIETEPPPARRQHRI